MKKIRKDAVLIIVAVLILILGFLFGGVLVVNSSPSSTQVENHDVWISPDGVHYWAHESALAPRYDHNGNLVIENWDIQ